MNVRGAPQKAGTDPREINYDLAEQATAATAGGGDPHLSGITNSELNKI